MRTVVLALVLSSGCRVIERAAVSVLDNGYTSPDSSASGELSVELLPVAEGLAELTDIQFAPGRSDVAVVLSKGGTAHTVDVQTGATAQWLSTEVFTVSEQGLLGLAFHPDFASNGRFFLYSTPAGVRPQVGRVEEWTAPEGLSAPATRVRTVLEVEQPYQNHNGGQLAFGPDGMLYIGLGDGGLRDDPAGNGQNRATLLGSLLRIDVSDPSVPYTVPTSNPFVGMQGMRPEIWAYGLRNPWRFSFTDDGTAIIADVGQDTLEEVSLARAGDNLGWSRMEAGDCFGTAPPCDQQGLVLPVISYGRDDGVSITGGYINTASDPPSLHGLYIYGDFVTGQMWAAQLPDSRGGSAVVRSLGKAPMLISTFGRDSLGRVYVGDFGGGKLWRFGELDPAEPPQ